MIAKLIDKIQRKILNEENYQLGVLAKIFQMKIFKTKTT
jgi:hypothetical protein